MAEHWRFVLNREIRNSNKIVLSSSLAVVLKDAFPKAKNHYLVVPKNMKIQNVFELSREHLPLLDDMFQLAEKLIDSLKMQPKDFLIGFKLDPSMQLLNLHVISTDFVSQHLKKSRHWTNFHTRVFLPHDAAYDQLKNKGSIEHLNTNELNKARFARLKCNSCEFKTEMFIDLKNHLFKHWEEKQNSRVKQLQEKQVIVTTTNGHVIKEDPITNSGESHTLQPSLKERFEALNKMFNRVSITNSDTNTTTKSMSACDIIIDQYNVASGLSKDLRCKTETLKQKENVCEQQLKQQNGTSDLLQNISNAKPQPSLTERLQTLSKRLETVSLTTTESTPTTATSELIPDCNKKLACDQVTLEHKGNICGQQQEQQNAALELSQNYSNAKPQPSLIDRLQALSELLKTDSVKDTSTSDSIKKAGPIDCSLIEAALKKDNLKSLNEKEQQNETLESTQNISNNNPRPSLKDRLAALTNIMEKDSAKVTETSLKAPKTTLMSKPISLFDVKIDLSMIDDRIYHKESRNFVKNKSNFTHNTKKRAMHHETHQQKQGNIPNNGDRSKNEYHKKPIQPYQRRPSMTSTNQPFSVVNTLNSSNGEFRSKNAYHKKPHNRHQGGAPPTSTNQHVSHGDTPGTSKIAVHLKKQFHKQPKQRYQWRPPATATSTNQPPSLDQV